MTDHDLARHFAPPRYKAGDRIVELRTHRPIVMIDDGAHTKRPYIPLGCDQQGRYPEAVSQPVAPAPAEASTEIGADIYPGRHVRRGTGEHMARVLIGATVIAILLCGAGWALRFVLLAMGARG